MDSRPETTAPRLEAYRDYLRLLARVHLGRRLQGKVDPSDVVQQALLRAHRNAGQFRELDEDRRAAWLRKILVRTISNEIRRFGQGKRDAALERSLLASLEGSTVRLEAWLADDATSPSDRAIRHEQLRRLGEALAAMGDDQRTAIELHHLKKFPLAEVARRMGRSKAAVAGLVYRGLNALRARLVEDDADSAAGGTA